MSDRATLVDTPSFHIFLDTTRDRILIDFNPAKISTYWNLPSITGMELLSLADQINSNRRSIELLINSSDLHKKLSRDHV